jgi:hypothetical protein
MPIKWSGLRVRTPAGKQQPQEPASEGSKLQVGLNWIKT